MSAFTIPFPEHDIANILQKDFPKKKNFSVAIPLSRQQKFYDLLLINGETKKSVTIQVKSSRGYLGNKKSEHQYACWLNHFDIKDNYSDFYFIYMTYPVFDSKFRPGAKWDRKILVFTRKEMTSLLRKVKTKAGKQERFFSFGFNATDQKISGQRGFFHWKNREFHENLYRNKLPEIQRTLKR